MINVRRCMAAPDVCYVWDALRFALLIHDTWFTKEALDRIIWMMSATEAGELRGAMHVRSEAGYGFRMPRLTDVTVRMLPRGEMFNVTIRQTEEG